MPFPFSNPNQDPGPEEKPLPEEEQSIEEAELEMLLSDPVYGWRQKRLQDNGMTLHQARALALDRSVDVTYTVNKLLKRGCDPAVAFDIMSGVMAA